MNATQLKIAVSAGLFLCIFLSGFWLSRSGKPYSMAIMTVHKLIALGTIIYLGVTVYNILKTSPHLAAPIAFITITAVCFIALIASGALLSANKTMPAFILKLHQFIPYLTLLSAGASLYLVFFKSASIQ
jgi:hypothetical protein